MVIYTVKGKSLYLIHSWGWNHLFESHIKNHLTWLDQTKKQQLAAALHPSSSQSAPFQKR